MLRTYITAGLIFIIIVFGGYWHNYYISKSSSILAEKLVIVEDQIHDRNWGNANQEIQKVKTEWNETKKLWSILLDHQEIDNIDLSLKKVEKYIIENETALSLGEVSALRLLFNHIADTETVTLQNIF